MSWEDRANEPGTVEQEVASLRAQVESLRVLATEDARLRRLHADYLDTFVLTPTWKRCLFILDGWPARRLADKPRWRPWHRWWVS